MKRIATCALLASVASCGPDERTPQRDDTGTGGPAGTSDGPGSESSVPGDSTSAADPSTTDGGAADSRGDDTGEPPEPTGTWDLDDDGVPESELSIAACADDPSATCLSITSPLTEVDEVMLFTGAPGCLGNLHGASITLLGDHDGGMLQEIAAAACRNDGIDAPPAVAVVDPDAGAVLAWATAPTLHVNAWVSAPADPDGLRHPVLAPSYGEGENPAGNWLRPCVYRPDLPEDPACHLAWSRYYGFSSTIFTTYSPAFVGNPAADVARLADVVDGCIHRFSDARSMMDGEDVLVLNVFAMDAPIDLCLDEQYDLYQEPAWTPEKADAWYECFGQNVAAPGVWGQHVLREQDGSPLTGSQETYVWGWTDALLPGGEVVYLVEVLPGSGAFDLSDRATGTIELRALVDGLWSARGAFPDPGRPRVLAVAAEGPRGVGSYTPFAELALQDRDRDGLVEVEREDGTFVGWNEATRSLVVKP